MSHETTIIGIDCSTNKKEAGLALAHSNSTGCVIQCVLTGDKAKPSIPKFLAVQIKDDNNPVLLALDSPLGWPDGLRGGLADHSAGAPLTIEPNRMFRRLTDKFVKKRTGKTPLDIGANWIARTAHWTLSLLEETRTSRHKIPLVWKQGQISGVKAIEVYPATVLISLGLETKEIKGYKSGESGKGARKKILDKLKKHIRFESKDEQSLLSNDDMLDAVLCVQAGQDFLCGKCVDPPKESKSIVRKEGWIWFTEKQQNNNEENR